MTAVTHAALDGHEREACRPTLATLGLEEDDARRRWLAAQEPIEGIFFTRLGERGRARLGLYHEALWQWIIAYAPLTRLLGHNLTIREGTQIRGELDLLFGLRPRHTAPMQPAIHHAELAIKFFLGIGAGPGGDRDRARWIGIGSFDSLAIKTHRLTHHQLPMARSAPAAASLPHLDDAAPCHERQALVQHVIMPGCLYHPWQRSLPLPAGSDDAVRQGLWCRQCEWHELSASLPTGTRAAILQKPHWLADQFEPSLTLDTLARLLTSHFLQQGAPVHCRLTLPDGRSARLFVVKDAWPPMIPLAPRPLEPSGSDSHPSAPSGH